MKVCNKCGTTLNDDAAFCDNCGASLSTVRTDYGPIGGNPKPVSIRSQKEPVSIGGWIGRSLIPLIPLVGGIVYLIMLFIWSGDTKKEDSFRNWAKAQLIVMAIVIVLVIIIAVVFGAAVSEIMSSMYY